MKVGVPSRGTASGRWQVATTLALGACLVAGSSAAQEPHREILAGKLQEQLELMAEPPLRV